MILLRPPLGVCEAHLHQSYKPFVNGAIPSQTYRDVRGWCPQFQIKDTTPIHLHWFVMELLQWQKVCKIGGDEVHRPPVVALIVFWILYNFSERCYLFILCAVFFKKSIFGIRDLGPCHTWGGIILKMYARANESSVRKKNRSKIIFICRTKRSLIG